MMKIYLFPSLVLTLLFAGCINSPGSSPSDTGVDSSPDSRNDVEMGTDEDASRDSDQLDLDVECSTSSECSPTTPICSMGDCLPCGSDGQCGSTRCLNNGACGDCLPETADSDCGGLVCDPDTFLCTDLPLGGDLDCTVCTYDAECATGACVAVDGGTDTRCLFRASERECAVTEGYTAVLSNVTSVNGAAPEDFCMNPDVSCDAIVSYRQKTPCPNFDDLICENGMTCAADQTGNPICTLNCMGPLDCPGLGTCDTTAAVCVYP